MVDGGVPGIDTTKPSIARTSDARLGGKDNFAVDRALADRFITDMPGAQAIALDNRAVLVRAIREIVLTTPVRQFLPRGGALPTADNVHQVAQRHAPDARVVYVDSDPVVLAHGRALLEENDHTHFSAADIFEPSQIINDEVVRRHLNFSEPIALFQIGTLHHYDGERSPQSIMAEYIDSLPSGSYVAISHFFDPQITPEL